MNCASTPGVPDLEAIAALFQSRFGSSAGAPDRYSLGLMLELRLRLRFQAIMELVEDAWLASEIPPDRVANACTTFTKLQEGESLLALFEHSGLIFKSKGKRGLAVTTHGLHWYFSEEFARPYRVDYREMNPDGVKYNEAGLTKAGSISLGKAGYEAVFIPWRLRRDLRGGSLLSQDGCAALNIIEHAFTGFLKQASQIWNAGDTRK